MKKILLISFVLIVAFLSVKGFTKNLNAVTEDGRKVILKADGTWGFLIDQKADDKDATYSIIDTKIIPGVKRSLAVRLNCKVTEGVLRSIALQLKRQDSKNYERTFITYYLPDMKLGAGAWATTHFNPDLDIRILGLTAEQEKNLLNEATDSSREVIGTWLDNSPVIGSRIMIYQKNHKFYMEQKFKNGSTSTTEMVEKASSKGRRFEEKKGSSSGDHYLIDRNGNLQMRDQYGLVATARKVK